MDHLFSILLSVLACGTVMLRARGRRPKARLIQVPGRRARDVAPRRR